MRTADHLEPLTPLERFVLWARFAGASLLEISERLHRDRLELRRIECAALRKAGAA